MSILWLLCLVQLWGLATSTPDSDSPFIEPSYRGKNVEFYDAQDVRYGIFLDKVSFQEAKLMCYARKGSLLELRDSVVAEFITRALAESAVGVSSLWIGAEYSPASHSSPGIWRWLSGEPIIKQPIPEGFTFPMDTPPYWVDRPDLNSSEPACLVTDRCLHHRPLVTGLPCNVRRPFICTLAPNRDATVPVETGTPIVSGNRRIHLFHAESTWAEALAYCRSLGYQLAVITRQEEFTKLQNRMRHVRPIMENAWTSGAYVNGKWTWVSTNQEIVTKNVTDDASAPWYRPPEGTDGCLLADRHLCEYFAYVEARCDRKRSFLCEVVEGNHVQPPLVRVKGSGGFYVSTVQLTWSEAQTMCSHCLEGGTLLQLAVSNVTTLSLQVQWLYKALAETTRAELRHIWLNGYLHGNRFTWGNSTGSPLGNSRLDLDIDQQSNSSLLDDNGDHGVLTFCPGDFKQDPNLRNYKCLNMDRENQKTFFMYGLSCSYKQHFVCTAQGDDDHHLNGACETVNVSPGRRKNRVARHNDRNKRQASEKTTMTFTTPSRRLLRTRRLRE